MSRERISLDYGWRFHLGDSADPYADFRFGAQGYCKAGEDIEVTQTRFDDTPWRQVGLPHDWAVELPFDRDMPRPYVSTGSKPIGRCRPSTTIGWYRRRLEIAAAEEGRRIWVEFDGVFRDCNVWLNGHLLGRHLGGYTHFRFDITDALNYGADNVLTVRVDATQPEGWFYEGAGIYRHVWLVKADPLHVVPDTLFVPYTLAKDRATLDAQLALTNDADDDTGYEIAFSVLDPNGRTVAKARKTGQLTAWSRSAVNTRITIKRPVLWDIESPRLYRLKVAVRRRGKDADEVETSFGLRTARWDADKGFLLNGRPVKIKGVCCHQDHAGVGSALPDRLQEYRIELLKEMGTNAYRTAHNAPTPELLDACDRLGMLVMDETRQFGSGAEQMLQLEALVRRDRNHPSVVIWSLGNEEHTVQATPVGRRMVATMKRLVRRFDPTRPVTVAMNNRRREGGFVGEVDILGWNYLKLGDMDAWHAAHPAIPIVGSEEVSDLATRGVYERDPKRAHVSSYRDTQVFWNAPAEMWWSFCAERPWYSGGFAWTGLDYRGEPEPYGFPGIASHFGIMDLCGFPKDHYWYYKAWWTEKPVLHLMPHWNWPGKEGAEIAVWCFSNADEVELELNGAPLGKQAMPRNGRCEWKVKYQPGVLLARAWRGGKRAETFRAETTGEPARLILRADRTRLAADGRDVSVVNVAVVDSRGRVVPTAENMVVFDVRGGTILGVGNGDSGSPEPDKADRRKAFGGLCQTIVQAPAKPGAVSVRATSEGLRPAAVTIRAG